MCEHDNVGLDTDDGTGDPEVRVEDPLLDGGMQGEGAEIDIVEDCGLEMSILGIVESLQSCEGGLIAVLRCAGRVSNGREGGLRSWGLALLVWLCS